MSETETPSPETPASSSLGRMKVLAFAALVVMVECALAFFFLPGPTDTAAMAASLQPSDKEQTPQADAENAPAGEESEAAEVENLVEIDLGQFSVAAYQPLTNSTLRIDFHLWGAVAEAEKGESEEILLHNAQRLREDVIITIRGAEVADLSDAGLGLIKRRILAKSNRLFGKPLLKAVIFSDFSFIEQ